MNALYRTAEALGVVLLIDTEVQHITVADGFATETILAHRDFPERVRFMALVAASGGFQGNREWLRKNRGDAAARPMPRAWR